VIDDLPAELADLKGGSAQNAIPREAFAVIALTRTAKASCVRWSRAAKANSNSTGRF